LVSFCPFSFGHSIACPLIYSFWLPLWYLQTFLASIFSFLCSKDWGKKSLKISKGLLETVSQRTDNTVTKRKRTNNDLQNTTQKTKDFWFTASDYLFGIFKHFLPQSLVFCVVFYWSLFVLWLTAFNYAFGIFKLFIY
jgi:hypothetical protein